MSYRSVFKENLFAGQNIIVTGGRLRHWPLHRPRTGGPGAPVSYSSAANRKSWMPWPPKLPKTADRRWAFLVISVMKNRVKATVG